MSTLLDWINAQSTDRKAQPYPHAGYNPQLQKQFDDNRYYESTQNHAQDQIVRGKTTAFRDVDPRDGHIRQRQPTRSFDHESTKELLNEAEGDIEAVIRKSGSGFKVKSEKGKNLGGPYKSRGEAEKRLAQVEYFKHKGK